MNGGGDRPFGLFGHTVQSPMEFLTPVVGHIGPPDLVIRELDRPDPSWPSTDLAASWASTDVFESGQAFQAIHDLGDGRWLHRFGEVAAFCIDDHRIDVAVLDERYRFMVEIRLFGPVMALVRELRGDLALHAACLDIDASSREGEAVGRGIALMGANRSGKTAIATALLQGGAALVSDDITAARVSGDHVWVPAAFPQMRMWPEDARRVVGPVDALELAHPRYDKLRVPVDRLGTFNDLGARLDAVYVVERLPTRVAPSPGVEIEELSGPAAVLALADGRFLRRAGVGAIGEAESLRRAAAIAERSSVLRLRYDHGLDELPALAALLSSR